MSEIPVAFADVMQQHWKSVWSFIYAMVRRNEVADDLAQETFIRAYRHWDDYRGESSVKTWLFTIAKHATTDYLRSAAVRRLVPFANTSHADGAKDSERQRPSAEAEFLDGVSVNEIWQAVLTLRRIEREVVILRVREDLSFREAAQILNISEGNARVQYHRAIGKLKGKLHAEVLADEL